MSAEGKRRHSEAQSCIPVRRNVAAAVKRPTIKRSEAHYLTLAEVGRLLEAAKSDRLESLIVTMLGTDLRRGEALALHWSDVDLSATHVRVRWTLSRINRQFVFDEPKTDRSRRFVPLPQPVVETLKHHRVSQTAERLAAPVWAPWEEHPDLVFTTPHRHAPRPQERAQGFREDRRARRANRRWPAHASAHCRICVDCIRCSSQGRAGDARAFVLWHHR